MTKAISRLNHHNQALFAVVLFGLVLLSQRVDAAEYKVGGANGWSLPSNGSTIGYSQWAEMHRFQVGDSILFVYQPHKDSVLQVTNDDFVNCNPSAPIASFNEGSTSFKLNQSGPYYFISGIKDNCVRNEKMVVIVMADRSNQTSKTNQSSTASPPSPPPSTPPSPLPYSSPPSPPPSGTNFGPTPAPTGEGSPPPQGSSPSAATYTLMSLISCVGAFVGSSFLLTL